MDISVKSTLLAAAGVGAMLIIAGVTYPGNAQELECRDRIQSAGKASVFGKGRAMRLAIDNWQREVRNLHGERFMQWDRAQEKTEECESASIGTFGKLNQRCVISAVPCASLAAAPGDSPAYDRDRDRGDRYDPRYDPRGPYRPGRFEEDLDPDPGEVQRLLGRWGYYVRVDGVWGEESRQALMRFQRRVGLEPDGEPGPRTMAALRRRPR